MLAVTNGADPANIDIAAASGAVLAVDLSKFAAVGAVHFVDLIRAVAAPKALASGCFVPILRWAEVERPAENVFVSS